MREANSTSPIEIPQVDGEGEQIGTIRIPDRIQKILVKMDGPIHFAAPEEGNELYICDGGMMIQQAKKKGLSLGQWVLNNVQAGFYAPSQMQLIPVNEKEGIELYRLLLKDYKDYALELLRRIGSVSTGQTSIMEIFLATLEFYPETAKEIFDGALLPIDEPLILSRLTIPGISRLFKEKIVSIPVRDLYFNIIKEQLSAVHYPHHPNLESERKGFLAQIKEIQNPQTTSKKPVKVPTFVSAGGKKWN